MNWKTRQMFSDREHGIVSGLSPINMTGGGNVPYPSYRIGGSVEPRSLLEWSTRNSPPEPTEMPFEEAYNLMQALSKNPTMPVSDAAKVQMERAFLLGGEEHIFYRLATGTNYQPSTQFKNTVKERVAQQVADQEQRVPGMQAGTGPGEAMAIDLDLFQQGDQDINQALNMMSGSVSPNVADIGPTAPTETIEETVTVTEDQGPITETVEEISIEEGPSEYQVELQALKETFKNEIRSYVSQADTSNLGKYLKNMNITYTNELDKLKQKYNVEIEDPNDKLLSSDFIEEIMSIVNPQEITQIPEMGDGGIVDSIKTQKDLAKYNIEVPIDVWLGMPLDQKKTWFYSALAKQAGGAGATGPDTSKLDELLAARMQLAGQIGKSAKAGYKSYLPRILHQREANIAGQAAQAGALDKVLADQIAMERALLSAGGSTSRFKEPADVLSAKILGVDDDLFDTSVIFKEEIKRLRAEYASYPTEQAIIWFADQEELPPFNTYRGKKLLETKDKTGKVISSTPVDWITYYKASKKNVQNLPDKAEDMNEYTKALLHILEDWKALPNA